MTAGDITRTSELSVSAEATPAASSLGVLLGSYRLVQRLGEGGMGVVHLGLDAHGRAVAIKVLRAHVAYDPDARARLGREVQTLARVQHPLVAEVLDADVDGDQPYVVTRYVPGPTLDAEVRERGPMPAAELVRLGRGLSSALEAIHAAGVVHRDLKPANVLILDGEPVVIDFGIAHVADDVRLTMTGLVMGTPGYLSPELVEGSAVTEATDWWGWAATLAYAATGRAPFGSGPVDVVIDRVRRGAPDLDGVDERLRPLLRAALAPDPSVRPRADEVLDALDRYAAGGAATVLVRTPATRSVGEATGLVTPPRPFAPPMVIAPPTLLRPEPVAWSPPPWSAPPSSAPPWPASPAPSPTWPAPTSEPAPLADPGPALPLRTGTMAALLLGLAGCASGWPTATAVVAAVLVVLARAVDRSVVARQRRQSLRGARGSDSVVSVLAAPWHLVRAGLLSVPALVLPLLLGVSAAFCVVLVAGGGSVVALNGTGDAGVSAAQVGAALGLVVGLLTVWWGPGGWSVRRGSRAVVRGVVRGRSLTTVVVVGALVVGAAAAYVAYSHGHPEFAPLRVLPFGVQLP